MDQAGVLVEGDLVAALAEAEEVHILVVGVDNHLEVVDNFVEAEPPSMVPDHLEEHHRVLVEIVVAEDLEVDMDQLGDPGEEHLKKVVEFHILVVDKSCELQWLGVVVRNYLAYLVDI